MVPYIDGKANAITNRTETIVPISSLSSIDSASYVDIAKQRLGLDASLANLPIDGSATKRQSFVSNDAANTQKTSSSTTGDSADGRSLGFTRQQAEQEQRNLARLASPRAQLSPTDEATLFGAQDNAKSLAATSSTIGQATAEDGSPVDVEIITDASEEVLPTSAQILSINPNALATAAQTYARNHEAVYDIAANSIAA